MRKIITNIEQLKNSERVLKHTKSYVPISTTDVISQYKQTKFRSARLYSTDRRNSVQAFLDNNIVLSNSYDGTQSFRIQYLMGEFVFGKFRLVHRGSNAKHFNENSEFYVDVLEKYDRFMRNVSNSEMSEETIKHIKDICTKLKGREVIIDYTSNKVNDVLNQTINAFKDGTYLLNTKRGIKAGRATKSYHLIFALESKISDLIIETYPEYFI